jgi:hypothetical protein
MTKKVHVVTGPKGVGKSTALATYPPVKEMAQTAVLDTEDSMSDIVELFRKKGYPFGNYIRAHDRYQADDDMLERMAKGDLPWVDKGQKNSLVGYYEWLVREMAIQLKPGAYKHLIIDTIEPIEAALTAAVQEGKAKFGWTGVTAYGRMETEGVRPLYEGLLEGFHRTGIETILIASHIKPAWLNKKPVPGKVKAGGRMAVLARLSTTMFWLVHNPVNEDGAPAALVLKGRMGSMDIDEDGYWVPRRVLPERIPHFSWQDVRAYRESPANYTNPKPGEVMAPHESEMIGEMLNDAQMAYMVMGAEAERHRQAPIGLAKPVKVEVPQEGIDKEAKAKAMASEGKPAPVIAQELGLPVPVVMSYLSK